MTEPHSSVLLRIAGQSAPTGGFGLPADLLARARIRVGRFALVMFVAVAVATITTLFFPWGEHIWVIRAIQVVTLLLALVLFVAARSRLGHATVLWLGLAYEVSQCMVSALGEVGWVYATSGMVLSPIWVSVMVVAYPLIVPSPPRTTFVVALMAAATVPLGIAILGTVTGTGFGFDVYLGASVHPAVAAVIATFGSWFVHGIHLEVVEARRIGSYELTEVLGRGGMGEVWRARHALLTRPAAVKLISPEALDSDAQRSSAALRRFAQEAEATANLRSAHTVEIYDFGVTREGQFYYVMELLDGIDLGQLVERYGPLPPNRVVHLLLQACHSLHEAHASGLVHRDIKPANLLVCRYGAEHDFIKVLDFGLVKEIEGATAEVHGALTGQGMVVGTPACMAPEMALGAGGVDGRADLYGLGCVAFWLLTGSLVFSAETPMQLLVKHTSERPEPPSTRSEIPIPEALDALVVGCLEKDPANRPQTAQDLAARLEALRIEPRWTEDDARSWWERHQPSGGGST